MAEQKRELIQEQDAKLAEQKREQDAKLAEQKRELIQEQDAKLAEQKRELIQEQDAKLAEQKRELIQEQDAKFAVVEKALEETKVFMEKFVDPRLQVWSAGAASTTGSEKSASIRTVRKDYKTNYGYCMACGCTEVVRSLTIAHIVACRISNLDALFGPDNSYVDKIVPESLRNYLVLCGTQGEAGTCHDYYDNMRISLYYDPEVEVFKWYSATGVAIEGLASRVLQKDAIGQKYLRLLAWRTLSTVLQPGPTFPGTSGDRAALINKLKTSEEEECDD